MKTFRFEGEYTRQISMPVGGIGAGCVGLAGNGGFTDWEVNGPGKGVLNQFTHFAVKAENSNGVVAKVLMGDHKRDLIGTYARDRHQHHGFGYGPDSGTMAGFPHFENAVFEGAFPWAKVSFDDPAFPGKPTLAAWSSFIPMNADDSSLPCAFYEVEIKNTSSEKTAYTIAYTLGSMFKNGVNAAVPAAGTTGISISEGENGMFALCDAPEAHVQPSWFRGSWFDGPTVYWNEFTSAKPLMERSYAEPGMSPGVIETRFELEPSESRRINFVLSWYYPTQINDWDRDGETSWKKWYATKFTSARDAAEYAMQHRARLKRGTLAFRDALYSCTIPDFALDAAGAALSTLVTPVCLRLTDGSFWAWEGEQELTGSCEGTCQHVWNYAYALPYLFPDLEKSVRRMERDHSQWDDGRISFRLRLPAGRGEGWKMPCVDGQMGYILKIYREWKYTGDENWLSEMWDSAKKAIAFAWLDTDVKWDPDKDGIIDGRQHHTLDMELFGPNAWLEGFYLAALKAMAEMAAHMGEDNSEYLRMFENGRKFLNSELFNGEYYYQKVDLTDKSQLDRFENAGNYWNDEAGEIKYQIGDGLIIDQCLAQWHANLMGLGQIYDKARLRTAMESLYRYNFKPAMRDFCNPCRVFSLGGEAGTVMCEYPETAFKPAIPVPYCQETMTGFEYAAASLMLQEGLTDKAEDMIRAVRDRYDGMKRNPWNEIECGNNYSRAMAAFSFVTAYAGFTCDAVKGEMHFKPLSEGGMSTMWFMGNAWGDAVINNRASFISAIHGYINLTKLSLPCEAVKVCADGVAVDFHMENGAIVFDAPVNGAQRICVTHK